MPARLRRRVKDDAGIIESGCKGDEGMQGEEEEEEEAAGGRCFLFAGGRVWMLFVQNALVIFT